MPPSQKKETEENLQFEEAIEKLESIIERMESEQIPLQELFLCFTRNSFPFL